jgi:hypothetical protein
MEKVGKDEGPAALRAALLKKASQKGAVEGS